MPLKHLVFGAAAAGCLAATLGGAPAAGPVQFVPHVIDGSFRGGYSVAIADFNKDGRPDVIANSLAASELAWYENPT
jgi:FG-GAP repeat protein